MTKTTIKAGGIVIQDGKLLICKRKVQQDYVLPKGHCDHGEYLEECAIREMKEETGFTCSILDNDSLSIPIPGQKR